MIDSSFEVILCYKAHPGKEINDSGGEFPGTSDFISSSYPSASRFLAHGLIPPRTPRCATCCGKSETSGTISFACFLMPHA